MTLKISLTTIALLLVTFSAVWGQTAFTSDVTIRSNPPGAQAILSGDITVSGLTPVRFTQLLVGDYELKVKRFGYDTYTTRIIVDPSNPIEVDVRLSKKSRFKAVIRSMFIPGWGQHYSGQGGKGIVYTSASAISVVAFWVAENWFKSQRDEWQRLKSQYADPMSLADKQALWPKLVAAQEDAYNAENNRRIHIGVVAGIWALNVIDAFLFFPEDRGTFSVKGLTVLPTSDGQGFGLALAKGF
jgi:hypothetical protein